MDDTCTYQILLRGQVDEDDINTASPLHLTVTPAGPDATLVTVQTDQSGLVGLIRHLHGLGFVLLSIDSSIYNKGKPHVYQS